MLEYDFHIMFCERLASLRIQKGVSAREMSLALGQSESYINKIENKKNMPSMDTFFEICDYLEITPVDFFQLNQSYPLEIKFAIEELTKLDRVQLERITGIMQDINKARKF